MTDVSEASAAPNPETSTPAPPVPPADPGSDALETDKDAQLWGMFCHLAGLGGIVIPVIGGIIGSLVIWLIKKDQYPFVDEQGKEAVNFQITLCIYLVGGGIITAGLLVPVIGILGLILLIMATIKAKEGQHYRYPKGTNFRFIK